MNQPFCDSTCSQRLPPFSADVQAYPFPACVVEIPSRQPQGEQPQQPAAAEQISSPSSGTCGSTKADDSPYTPSPPEAAFPVSIRDNDVSPVVGGAEGPLMGKTRVDSLASRSSGSSDGPFGAMSPMGLPAPQIPSYAPLSHWERRSSSLSRSVHFVDGTEVPELSPPPLPPPPPSQPQPQQTQSPRITVTPSADVDLPRSEAEVRPPEQPTDYFDPASISPLSKPTRNSPLLPLLAEPSLTPPRILWTNHPYDTVTSRSPLNGLVESVVLTAFRNWLLGIGNQPAVHFTLALSTGYTLDMIKTIQTGVRATYAVVTCVRVSENPHAERKTSATLSSQESPSSKPRLLDPTDELRPLITRSSRRRSGRRSPQASIPQEANGLPPPPRHGSDETLSCAQLLLDTKWEETPAGPMKDWPPEVHSMIRLIFTSSDQDSIWVGSDMRLV